MKTIQEQINNWLDTGKCQCKLCERGRNFARIIQTIESTEDQEWMFWFYDGVVSTEEELGLQEYWVKENQKRIDKLLHEKELLMKFVNVWTFSDTPMSHEDNMKMGDAYKELLHQKVI